ncbi:hypothetical protein TNCV_171711 [Trichonephila clavipes]|nr:hypothetical protein TNCV_171711 [Trichonephila clavipes]
MYTTTEITACPFSNKHSDAVMSPNIVANAKALEYLMASRVGPPCEINGDRYRAMITNFFTPELNNHDVQELWLQQDGATCHTARATIDLLKDTFGDRLISRFGPVNKASKIL